MGSGLIGKLYNDTSVGSVLELFAVQSRATV